jgi:transcriptional regulator
MLAPKHPWRTEKMPEETLERLMRAIVPARLDVRDVQGTWKLNQNKPEEARRGAAEAIAASPVGSDPAGIARLMQGG